MNGYIVNKKITLNGVSYDAGEVIAADAVLPSRVATLQRTGVLTEFETYGNPFESAQNAPETVETVGVISLPITTENGVKELSASCKSISKAVEVLQMNAEGAASAIADITSGDVLAIISACDSRKTVQKAAKSRLEEIAAENGGDE